MASPNALDTRTDNASQPSEPLATSQPVNRPNPHSFRPIANDLDRKGASVGTYIAIAVLAVVVIVGFIWRFKPGTSSAPTQVPTAQPASTESPYGGEAVEEVVEVVEEVEEEVAEAPESECANANADADFITLKSLMELSGKKRSDAIAYLKGQGFAAKDGGSDYNGQPIYYFEVPNGTISINNEGMPHIGTGAVEFMTESKVVYSNWIKDLRSAGYSSDGDGIWHGDNAHYFTFGLYDTADMSPADDYAGCYTLCVKTFPMVYDKSSGHYVDYEYEY